MDAQLMARNEQQPPTGGARSLAARAVTVGRWAGAAGTVAFGVDQLLDPMPTAVAAGALVATAAVGRAHARWLDRTGRVPADADGDPLAYVRGQAARLGGGAFIGLDASDDRSGILTSHRDLPPHTTMAFLNTTECGPQGRSAGAGVPSLHGIRRCFQVEPGRGIEPRTCSLRAAVSLIGHEALSLR